MTNNLITISNGMNELATSLATQIDWSRGIEKFQRCLCCSRGCHYNRFPNAKEEYWNAVWALLKESGVDPTPIQETMSQKLKSMPWTSIMPYEHAEVLQWISEQLPT